MSSKSFKVSAFKAYFLSSRTKLGYDAIREIFETGYSLLAELERGRGAEAVWSINDLKNNITTLQGRIPIYGMDKHDYRGLLYTKDNMKAVLLSTKFRSGKGWKR